MLLVVVRVWHATVVVRVWHATAVVRVWHATAVVRGVPIYSEAFLTRQIGGGLYALQYASSKT